MPVLFAYLVALVVFLGGSYEALTWLAATEPMKIVRASYCIMTRPPPISERKIAAIIWIGTTGFHEIKHDAREKSVRLFTRNGHDWVPACFSGHFENRSGLV